jgi:hypothetical protein
LSQLSTDLIKTYDAAIARIHAEPDGRDTEIALKALMWITFAKEPLEADVLLHALAVREDKKDLKESDLENIRNVVSLCVGLAAVDQEGGEIRLVHETTKEYLEKYFRDEQKEDGDATIAKVCLHYFSFPAFSRRFESQQALRDHLDTYRLSGYAARYWLIHVRDGNLEEKLGGSILKTFERQDTRDSVFQMAVSSIWNDDVAVGSPLLHLAAIHGLPVLCREILRRTSQVHKL